MRHAQLVAFGVEGRLEEVLRELARERSIWLRDVRQVKTCLNVLREGGARVLVLKLTKDGEEELQLLEQVSHLFPPTRTIVVASDQARAALAWDLGAAYVLVPPAPVESIRDVVLGFVPA
jgi:hypothetical protein